MSDSAHETDIHDLSLGVMHALELVEVRRLSCGQLRRLYAALVHACNDVDAELANRSDDPTLDDTVKLRAPDVANDDLADEEPADED